MKTTRDDFDYWVFYMDDALEEFLSRFPEQVREKLNFSPESLNIIEQWILDTYPDVVAMRPMSEARAVDGAARYIGETFRKALGAHWTIRLDDPRFVYYGLPILVNLPGKRGPVCPLSLATTTADRRTGSFLRSVLEAKMPD